MTTPDVDTTGFVIAAEASFGTLPGSPIGFLLEPNTVTKWGAALDKKSRKPISKDRMTRPSVVTDLTSDVEMSFDTTMEHARIFLDYAMMADRVGWEHDTYYPTAVTATGYTVASGGALADGRLVWASGLRNSQNNGLKVLAGTSTGTEIKTTGLTVEADVNSGANSGQNATVEICGVQGATADFRLTADGDLTTEAAGLDMTTLGWVVGEILHLGDPASGAAFRFATITDDQYANGHGFVRIRAITAHLVTLDKNEVLDANGVDAGAGKTIRVLYGPFLREWADDHANFNNTYQQFEAEWLDLDGGSDAYEYAKGNLLNELKWEMGLSDLSTLSVGWVGKDTAPPVAGSRASWANLFQANMTTPYGTADAWRRRRICTTAGVVIVDELKELSLTIRNNITREVVQGGNVSSVASRLGAYKLNKGDREVMAETTWLYAEPDASSAVRNNTKLTGDFCIGGEQGGFYVDLPALRLADGSRGLERHTSVTVKLSVVAEKDAELGYMCGITRFPYLP